MAEPSNKSPDIEAFLSAITGRDRREQITNNKCMTCGGDAHTFRNDLSRREFSISGMCQACQDSVFGTAGEDEA